MSIERTPERRGGRHAGIWLSAMVLAALMAGLLIVYFMGVADPLLGKGGPPEDSEPVAQLQPTPSPEPPTPTPSPGPAAEPTPQPKVIPEVDFGEVSAEGWVTLDLPGGEAVETWYTFQVDTGTRDITLFFALYNDSNALTSTVKAEQYTRGVQIDNAEVTLYYPDGPKRLMVFDGAEKTLTETQEYRFKPYEPSIFSPGLRSNLVYYQVLLQDEAGTTRVELDRDLSGLLGREAIAFERSAASVVDRTLVEIGLLVNQIEEKRQ